MGDVFLAVAAGPMGFSKLVVVKTMRPRTDDEKIDRVPGFFEEARVAARLNHPNIVQTFEIGSEGATHFIVMEYIEGQPLASLLHALKTPLDPILASHVMKQLLEALQYVHELCDYDGTPLKLVHRDVSPENVILTYGADAKLVDFGIAKAASSAAQTAVGIIKGKLSYMAPEQARSETVDHRADLFAAGLVFWELLTGRRLIHGQNDVARAAALLFMAKPRVSEIVPDVAPALDAIVAKALEMAPDDRFASAKEMRDAIDAVLVAAPGRQPREELAQLMTDRFSDLRAKLQEQIAEQIALAPERPSQLVALRPTLETGGSGARALDSEDTAIAALTETVSGVTASRTSDHLPALLSELLGREAELEAAAAALVRTRLLTLVGPGGTGKTALAIATGHTVASRFPGGAHFVPLAALTDPKLVAAAIADACGVREMAGQPGLKTLQAFFGNRKVLLVIDNFEQVIDAVSVVAELLAACPELRVIVTSRVVLRVQGEREFHVPPLPVPNLRALPPFEQLRENPAVLLFCNRARDVSGFELTAANGHVVAQICAQLDGLPLAIELAAARTNILPPERLVEKLGERLRILTSGARNLPVRQRTLRGTIAWSYDLLTAAERELFERLAIFNGGWSLVAAEAIAPEGADVYELLGSLVDKSLLSRASSEREPRFRMLETIHEFALDRLRASGRHHVVARAHAEYFRAFAAEAGLGLQKHERVKWMGRLAADQDNVRAAIQWSIANREPELGLDIVGDLWSWYQSSFVAWYHSSFVEGGQLCDDLIKAAVGRPPSIALAKGLFTAGHMAWSRVDLAAMQAYAEQNMAVGTALGHSMSEALARASLAASLVRDPASRERAAQLFEEANRLVAGADDPRGGLVKGFAAAFYTALGDLERARGWLEEAERHFERTGGTWQLNVVRTYRGIVELHSNRLDLAEQLLGACIPVSEADGHTLFLTLARVGYALTLRRKGDMARAAAAYARALANCRDTGDVGSTPICLEGVASCALFEGRGERALWLLGAARAARDARRFGNSFDNLFEQLFSRTHDAAVQAVTDVPRRETALRQGAEATREAVFVYALESA